MATLDWPQTAHFKPSALSWGVNTPRSAWQAFYTGQRQSISHLADRLRCTVTLPVVADREQAAQREAFFFEAASAGHWLRLWHWHRQQPLGTLRGSPVLAAAAAAAARSLAVQTTPFATLLGGDMLSVGSTLVMVGSAGAVANSGGLMAAVPLALPLLRAATAGAAVGWFRPTAEFQLETLSPTVEYGDGWLQEPLQLELTQVLA